MQANTELHGPPSCHTASSQHSWQAAELGFPFLSSAQQPCSYTWRRKVNSRSPELAFLPGMQYFQPLAIRYPAGAGLESS